MPGTGKGQPVISARPPIVVVLGHVDHGKTSILDKIRQTKVAEKEAGGITQHIGAYQVEVPKEPKSRENEANRGTPRQARGDYANRIITFLDTPGHEAFSAIRSRGAKVADIAILVVAADESVKPQTKEAIQIIKVAEIPFVVAINKTDKEGANTARVRQELAEEAVLVEDYGGTVPVVELSARTGEGINELLEMILLVAEMEELAASVEGPASGIVVESHMDRRRGIVSTLVVQNGELKTGDWVSAGAAIGRVKSLEDFLGKPIALAVASQPCVMLGWEGAPRLGQQFQATASRQEAEKISSKETTLGPAQIFLKEAGAENTNKKIANLIVKTDVQSSLEAIDQALKTIHSEEVDYRVVNFGVGNINDADVKNALAMGGSILGFHVEVDGSAKQMAERENIKILTSDIIYELIEAARLAMSDLLEPEIRRIPLGKIKILATFKTAGKSQIIGGKITQGKVIRNATIDVIRNGALLTTGRLGQLQHDKADIAEANEGLEVGVRFDLSTDSAAAPVLIKEGDVLEIYQEEKIKRTI